MKIFLKIQRSLDFGKRILLGLLVPITLLSGCDLEDLEGHGIYPRKPGRTIAFGASVASDASGILTKTEYTGERTTMGTTSVEKIKWLSGDEIVVYGENVDPAGTNPSRYGIVPASNGTDASLFTISAPGLAWGTSSANFYGVYPSLEQFNDLHTDLGPMTLSNTSERFEFVSGIPAAQPGISTTAAGNARIRKPDMSLAPMLAVTRDVSLVGSTPVGLAFFPLMTAFEMKLSNTLPSGSLSIRRVSLIKESGILWQNSFTYSFKKSGNLNSHDAVSLNVVSPDLAGMPGPDAGNTVFIDFGTSGISIPVNGRLDLTLFAVPANHKGLALEVLFTDGTKKTLRLNDSDGTPIQFDKYRKHVISVGVNPETFEYYFTFTQQPAPLVFSFLQENGTFKLHSYKVSSLTHARTEVAWTTEFSTDGGATWSSTIPEMFKSNGIPLSGEGTTYMPATIQYKIDKQKYEVGVDDDTNPHTIALRSRAAVSNVDLSLRSPIDGETLTTRNTANCYVVRRAGTGYKFPCVYGNAIKNGGTNEGAYKTSGELEKFKDYQNKDITQPYIKHISTSHTAVLVWQSVPDLISNVSLTVGNQLSFISFDTAGKDAIREGNAVIALRDKQGKTVWSWHIWITDEMLTPVDATNNTGRNIQFMPRPLGWVSTNDLLFSAQEVIVRLTQTESGKQLTFTLSRPSVRIPNGTSPYYQWGRKDPFPSRESNGAGYLTQQTVYTANGYTITHTTSQSQTLGTAIQHPTTYYYPSNTNWLYLGKMNLWDANLTERFKTQGTNYPSAAGGIDANSYTGVVVKTVYAPSPSGFTVPVVNAFSGFTRTPNADNPFVMPSGTTNYLELLQITNGYLFYTGNGHTGNLIFFPCLGYGKPDMNQRIGMFWTAAPAYDRASTGDPGTRHSFSFTFSGSGSNVYFRTENSSTSRKLGAAIFPAVEE